ncbi:hypothetical protein [Clostridium sp. UBA4395]|uniref:hypothetical protein n=1 Tax=Clostridium sp. UBA4395 TaxID=1946360 RepID=UPI0032164CE0
MKLYSKLLIVVMFTLSILIIRDKTFYGKSEEDMVSGILNSVNASTEEYVVEGRFYSQESKENIYETITTNIEKAMGQVYQEVNKNLSFKIDYNHEEYDGRISIADYGKGYDIVLRISICKPNLDIDKEKTVEKKIKEILSPISSKVEYSLYVKSKILNGTIDETRDVILKQLYLNKAQNIDEVEISNGYSIISNTNLYDKEIILGEEIDFNCAIVRYSSGCYLIMGTPVIRITY